MLGVEYRAIAWQGVGRRGLRGAAVWWRRAMANVEACRDRACVVRGRERAINLGVGT